MTVNVYIWLPALGDSVLSGLFGQSVGHSSLETSNSYISFFPENGVKKLKVTNSVPSASKSYKEDLEKYGHPNHKISLYNLDEKRIDIYWDCIRKENYNAMSKNCSTVVVDALKEGFSYRYEEGNFLEKLKFLRIYIPKNWLLLLSSTVHTLGGNATYWEPMNVLEFAKLMKVVSD